MAAAVAIALPAPAAASTPRVGGPCTKSEASSARQTSDGTRVVCVYLNSGRYQWQRLSNPSPVN
ncbi:hypothetical protein GOEFS_028_00250 [Gordonia effusa NBRC 100432]|uniref:Uncharacterized protein n=1 Tax=Gordonia effusa NBRC 100432 TaxID=1077974 RepID=H0QX10_9ACTN|nr:hypothetical protein GOEFS_028_00250 [Gordonia effusa NBRC 100432]